MKVFIYILLLSILLVAQGYRSQNRSIFKHRDRKVCLNALFKNRKTVQDDSPAITAPPSRRRRRDRVTEDPIDESSDIRDNENEDQRKEESLKEPTSTVGNYWINEDYGKNFTERTLLWNHHKQLSSIGETGLTEKHVNSLLNLAQSHNYIKVKISSHKLDSIQLAEQYFTLPCKASEELIKLVYIYEIRHRGIMFRRVELLPEKVYPVRELRGKPPRKERHRKHRIGGKKAKTIGPISEEVKASESRPRRPRNAAGPRSSNGRPENRERGDRPRVSGTARDRPRAGGSRGDTSRESGPRGDRRASAPRGDRPRGGSGPRGRSSEPRRRSSAEFRK